MILSTILARLDALPATLESLRFHYPADDLWLQRAEQYYPLARQALERTAVAVEDVLSYSDVDFTPVRFIETLERIKPPTSTVELNKMFDNAFDAGDVAVVQILLIDGRVTPQPYHLKTSVTRGYIEIIKLLLEDGRVDPAHRSSEALCWVAIAGNDEIVKLLLNDGRSDPTADLYYACRCASKNGHVGVVQLFLDDPRVDTDYCKLLITN